MWLEKNISKMIKIVGKFNVEELTDKEKLFIRENRDLLVLVMIDL
jgi:hypothetical protein